MNEYVEVERGIYQPAAVRTRVVDEKRIREIIKDKQSSPNRTMPESPRKSTHHDEANTRTKGWPAWLTGQSFIDPVH